MASSVSYSRYLLILCLLPVSVVCQTTVTINPVKDNTLYESATGSLSDGKGQFFFVGRTNTNTTPDGLIRRAILKFDVSTIPAGSTITDVSLTMRMDKTGNTNAFATTLHTVSADWGEGNSDASANEGGGAASQTNDATWIHRFYSTTFWTNVGGDFNATASASTNVGAVGNYTWTSAQLITDVQNMLDNPSSNFGWIVKGNEAIIHTAKRFVSRENATVANRLKLVITYCTSPTITSFTPSVSEICTGASTTLTVSGNLNHATSWSLYSFACGTTLVSSNTNGIFQVSPTVTTTYFVRGEGGCVSVGACETTTITVLANPDPSFHYSSQQYCTNDVDPSATITGTAGGTFTRSPTGLSINASTGLIDVSASATGTYTVTYTISGTCPASSSVSVKINPVFNTNASRTICSGESFVFGQQTLTSSGNYVQTFQSINGCDSTVSLALTVSPTYTKNAAATICENENYIFGTQTLTTAGIFVENFQAKNGCDSTVTLTLGVNEIFNNPVSATICQGDNFLFASQTLTTAGIYEHTFASMQGCDSVVVLTLTVYPTFTTQPQVTICEGESYLFAAQPLSVAGIYEHVVQSKKGCDSTVVLNLQVQSTIEKEAAASICSGKSYTFGSQTLSVAGIYEETFQSGAGCDSTVTLSLTVNPIYNEVANATICEGEDFSFGTELLETAGEYEHTFQSIHGCDSTVTLTLEVNLVNSLVTSEHLTLTATATGAIYQWLDCNLSNSPINNETNQSFTATINGEYAVRVTENGCSEISDCFEVVVVGLRDSEAMDKKCIFPNPFHDILMINLEKVYPMVNIKVMNNLGQVITLNFENIQAATINTQQLVPGMYFVTIQTLNNTLKSKLIKQEN